MPTFYDRIAETWSGTGTGTITLSGVAVSGPPGGFRAFSGNVTNGVTVRILITHQTTTEWEVVEGVYNSGAGTVTRVTVTSSSNSGSLVNFSAGVKHVAIVDDAAWMNTVVTVAADGGAGAMLVTNGSGTRSFSTQFVVDASAPTITGTAYSTTDVPIYMGRRARGTSGSPTAAQLDDVLVAIAARGYGATGWSSGNRSTILCRAAENWTDSAQGAYIQLSTSAIGAATNTGRVWIYQGVVVGAATGGDKGAGTINCAGDVHKNGTAFTSPDYVFEHHYSGKIERYKDNEGAAEYTGLPSLESVEEFARANYHLPQISRECAGIFARADKMLELIESLYLYAIDADKRIKELESRVS